MGVGTISPETSLHIFGSGTDHTAGITLDYNSIVKSRIFSNNDSDNPVYITNTGSGGFKGGYVDLTKGPQNQMNFTGQHRNMLNTNINVSSRGLIVSSTEII